MFISLVHDYATNTVLLKDSNFQENIGKISSAWYVILANSVKTYESRRLHVPANIAKLYLYWKYSAGWNKSFVSEFIKEDAAHLETTYPGLRYKQRYLNCVLRNFSKLIK